MCSPAKQPERGRTLAAVKSVTHQQQEHRPSSDHSTAAGRSVSASCWAGQVQSIGAWLIGRRPLSVPPLAAASATSARPRSRARGSCAVYRRRQAVLQAAHKLLWWQPARPGPAFGCPDPKLLHLLLVWGPLPAKVRPPRHCLRKDFGVSRDNRFLSQDQDGSESVELRTGRASRSLP